jgi:hypothetical protein
MVLKIIFCILILATVSCIANIDKSKKSGDEFSDSIQGVITKISNHIIPTAHAASELCGSVSTTNLFATLYGVTSSGDLVALCSTDINPSTGKYNFKTKQSEISLVYQSLKIEVEDLSPGQALDGREAFLLPTEMDFNIDTEKSAVSKAIQKIDFAGFLVDPVNNMSIHRERYASNHLRTMFAGVFDSGAGTPTTDDLVNLENFFFVIDPAKVLEIKTEAEKSIPLPIILSTELLCSVDYTSSTSCFKTHTNECVAEYMHADLINSQTNFELCLMANGGVFTPHSDTISGCVDSVKEMCTLHGKQAEYYQKSRPATNTDVGVMSLLEGLPFSGDTWGTEFYAYVHGIKLVNDCSTCVASGFTFLGCMEPINSNHGCCTGPIFGCPSPTP